ncbi:MAG: hypothetical protein Q7R85_03805 [bacterium]|nr:hypothetical protein [bacterium]
MPNQIWRAGRTFLVFGTTAMLGVFVFLFALGGTETLKKVQAPRTAVMNKISLKAVGVTTDALPNAGETTQNALDAGAGMNATQDLAKQLAAEIVKRNPAGPGAAGAQKLNLVKPADAVDKFIAEGLASFDPEIFYPRVAITDLHIITDSQEAFQTYIRASQNILREKFAGVHFENLNDLSKMNFSSVLPAYKAAVDALLQLPVPQSLATLHQKEIALIKGQEKMMSFLARYNDDPLQAYLALNVGSQLSQEFSALDLEVSDFITKHQIAI